MQIIVEHTQVKQTLHQQRRICSLAQGCVPLAQARSNRCCEVEIRVWMERYDRAYKDAFKLAGKSEVSRFRTSRHTITEQEYTHGGDAHMDALPLLELVKCDDICSTLTLRGL